jgi:DNA-binding NarL/FixJ family response regulator
VTNVMDIADSGQDMARLTACVSGMREARIVRHASGRAPVARLVAAQGPTLVLIGEIRPFRLTFERLTEVRVAAPAASIVVVAAEAESRWLAEALRLGATAVLPGGLGTNAIVAVLQELTASTPGGAPPLALAA